MRSPDDPPCKHTLSLSHAELDSLRWLLETVGKIAKNPKNCNRHRAALAEITVEKMRDAINDMHAELHILEEAAAESHERVMFDNVMIAASKLTSKEGVN
jgi:hypothetical protein